MYGNLPHGFVSLSKAIGNKRDLLEEHGLIIQQLMEGHEVAFQTEATNEEETKET